MWIAGLFKILGWIFLVLGLAFLVPAVVALVYLDFPALWIFLIATAFSAFLGSGIIVAFRGVKSEMEWRTLLLLPVAITLLFPVMGAVPLESLTPGLGFFRAYFEAVSAFTTTGATVLDDPSALTPALLFFRSYLGWLGGLTAIVLSLTVFQRLNLGAQQLFQEGLPVNEGETIAQQVRNSFKDVTPVYLVLTLLAFLLLMATGTGAFPGLLLAMSALSTTGLTGAADGSMLVTGRASETVMMLVMLVGAMNLAYFWRLFHARGFREGRFAEIPYVIYVFLTGAVLVIIFSWPEDGPATLAALYDSVHQAFFIAASAISTTGISPAGGVSLAVPASLLVAVMVFIGGGVGSSAGGIKIYRIIALLAHARRELVRLAHPNSAIPVMKGTLRAGAEDYSALWLLLFSFILFLGLGTLILSALELDFASAAAVSLASLATAGPAAHLMDPAFAGYNALTTAQLGVSLVFMIIGRLEVVLALALVSLALWHD